MSPHDPPEVLKRFESELRLVEIIAHQLRAEMGEVLDHEELVSFGREGLLVAARRYDPNRGVSFRQFANYRVRGAMIDGMRSHGARSRRAQEKLRALRAAQTVSEGMYEDTAASIVAGLNGAAADQQLAKTLASMATAMAVGFMAEAAVSDDEFTAVDEAGDPEEEVARAEMLRLLRAEIQQLSEVEAALVRRHFFEGEQLSHVAASLGLSKSWGSRMLARAIAKLTERLVPCDAPAT